MKEMCKHANKQNLHDQNEKKTLVNDPVYQKVIMRIKTTASKPEDDSSSSSESFHALLTQPGDGINLSRLKPLLRVEVPSTSKRGI